MKECRNCVFYDAGDCHRYPPQVWADPDTIGSCFPSVKGDDWCGEFEKKQRDTHLKSSEIPMTFFNE